MIKKKNIDPVQVYREMLDADDAVRAAPNSPQTWRAVFATEDAWDAAVASATAEQLFECERILRERWPCLKKYADPFVATPDRLRRRRAAP